jgi:hypothetical protein
MALPTWQDVLNIAPGDAAAFSDPRTPVAAQVAILAIATSLCAPSAWGAQLNIGIVYMAAHLAKLGQLRGTGAVTQEAVGQLSRQYQTVQGVKGSLGLTSYGAMWSMLARMLPTAIGAVG